MQPSGSQEIQTPPRESQDNPSTRRVLPTRRFHDEDIVISAESPPVVHLLDNPAARAPVGLKTTLRPHSMVRLIN